MQVYFYPHAYLRDRQLDTIRHWPAEQVVNRSFADRKSGRQVDPSDALIGKMATSWKQKIPLPNIKLRPAGLEPHTIVYVWGGLIATGPFIVELDNPYALVGYNLPAMAVWRPLLRQLLLSNRCEEIRCMSEACRKTLRALFGEAVAAKATVHYPQIRMPEVSVESTALDGPRFLFVGTQFEIKGGAALLRAWPAVKAAVPSARLDMITHLPAAYEAVAATLEGLTVHEAKYSRDRIWADFMSRSDVLVLPTFVESFGMAALEALAHGLAIIVTDVYALGEMVDCNRNGVVIDPPLYIWNNDLPTSFHYRLPKLAHEIQQLDTHRFEVALASAMSELGRDTARLLAARRASLALFHQRFSQEKIDG